MKFVISKASEQSRKSNSYCYLNPLNDLDWVYCLPKPHDKAKLVITKPEGWDKDYPETVGKDRWWVVEGYPYDTEKQPFAYWEIEFETLSELTDFIKENKKVVIDFTEPLPEIMIYDYWIE